MADTNEPKPMHDLFRRSKPGTAPELGNGTSTSVTPDVSVTPMVSESDDPVVDAAVTDIIKSDADEALKIQDQEAEAAVIPPLSRRQRVKTWLKRPRVYFSLIGIGLLALAILGAIPSTRNNIAGLLMEASVTVTVVDSKSGAPVSGATVQVGGVTAETGVGGNATLRVHAGNRVLRISKQYYKNVTRTELVALTGSTFTAKLVALGHKVQVKVVNKLTGKPVSDADVSVHGTTTKTSANGTATVVLASSASTQSASVSVGGYNTTKVNIIAGGVLAQNTFSVTPTGKLYFLSNLSGLINVVKTNLDGSDRQVVLQGTGNEDPNTMELMASHDWKYLALVAKRSGGNADVYLINTTNGDSLTTIDNTNATFHIVGWSNDHLIYSLVQNNVPDWQTGQSELKSYDATTGRGLVLDQTQATGTDSNNYVKQTFGSAYIMGDQVIYAKNWQGGTSAAGQLASASATLDSINVDGSGHTVIKTFGIQSGSTPATPYIGLTLQLYEPGVLHIMFQGNTSNGYYSYTNGQVTADSALNDSNFYQTSNPAYYLSPSGQQTFWADQRDGKNTLLVGNQDAGGQKQVASLSDYSPYGWFTDNYLLVSKNGDELYIMPTSGGTPYKVTDYYNLPTVNSDYGSL